LQRIHQTNRQIDPMWMAREKKRAELSRQRSEVRKKGSRGSTKQKKTNDMIRCVRSARQNPRSLVYIRSPRRARA
jgi:hypothetical protein